MLLTNIVYEDIHGDISSEILNIKELLKKKNINLGISEIYENHTHILRLFVDDNSTLNNINSIYIYLSNIIYKILINEYCNKELIILLKDTYFFLTEEETKDVLLGAKDALIAGSNINDDAMLFYIRNRNIVTEKIKSCIEENKEINIRGFLRFRMNEFKSNLEEVVDKVVEKYMVEKEYNEFIELLKYFVDTSEKKFSEINILIEKDGKYSLIDNYGKDIFNEFVNINDICENEYKDNLNNEDVIISALITNNPENIKIHCIENCINNEFILMIKNVFCERVNICKGCKLCYNYSGEVKE